MTKYESFLDYVLPHVPGATVPMALHEIKNTVIDFCERTLVLQDTLDPITTIAQQSDYDLDYSRDYIVAKVMLVWFNGNKLFPVAPDLVNDEFAYTNSIPTPLSGPGTPLNYMQKTQDTITLLPVPDKTIEGSLIIRAALKPSRINSTGIADEIFEQYADHIGHGARARLMSSPGKPYTNMDDAVLSQSYYERGVNAARQKAIRGFSRADQRVQYRSTQFRRGGY